MKKIIAMLIMLVLTIPWLFQPIKAASAERIAVNVVEAHNDISYAKHESEIVKELAEELRRFLGRPMDLMKQHVEAVNERKRIEKEKAEEEARKKKAAEEEAARKKREEENSWKLLGTCTITHYCACSKCNGNYPGQTASGVKPKTNRTVAMYGIPFGTKVKINGKIYVVEDRGVGPNWVDIFVGSHEEAYARGKYKAKVYIKK